MKLGFASDHRGYDLKNKLIEKFRLENEIKDYGSFSEESSDYPDFAFKLGEGVANNEVDFGIAICGTGIGISIACNKVKGVRCAKVEHKEEVIATRKDNDANIIAFGEKMPLNKAAFLVKTFISTGTSQEEKHVRRRNKIKEYEENN